MAAHAVPGNGGSCSWEGMKKGGDGHFLSIPSCPTVPITLGVPEPKDLALQLGPSNFYGPPKEACGKGLVIALDLPKSWHPAWC